MKVLRQITDQQLTQKLTHMFAYNGVTYCVIAKPFCIEIYQLINCSIQHYHTLQLKNIIEQIQVQNITSDNNIIYINTLVNNKDTVVYNFNIQNKLQPEIFMKLQNILIKQLYVIQNKYFYITNNNEFYVYKSEHVKLKNVQESSYLCCVQNEVFCIENSFLIFVTNYKRQNLNFKYNIKQLVKIDTIIYVLTENDQILKLNADNQVEILLNLENKRKIQGIFSFNQLLFILSQEKFLLVESSNKLVAKCQLMYQYCQIQQVIIQQQQLQVEQIQLSQYDVVVAILTSKGEIVFTAINLNKMIAYYQLQFDTQQILQSSALKNSVIIQHQQKNTFKKINLDNYCKESEFIIHQDLIQSFVIDDFFIQLCNNQMYIKHLTQNTDEIQVYLGDIRKLFIQKQINQQQYLCCFYINSKSLKFQFIDLMQQQYSNKIKLVFEPEQQCSIKDIILTGHSLVFLTTHTNDVFKFDIDKQQLSNLVSMDQEIIKTEFFEELQLLVVASQNYVVITNIHRIIVFKEFQDIKITNINIYQQQLLLVTQTGNILHFANFMDLSKYQILNLNLKQPLNIQINQDILNIIGDQTTGLLQLKLQ